METLMQKIQHKLSPDISTPDFDRSIEEETCPDCRGCGVQIIKDDKGYEFAHDCICAIKNRTEKYLATSGISEAFRRKTLKNFSVAGKPEIIQKAKAVAREYVENYHQIKKTNTNSIGFFGTVGSGKTHLTVAIANELMHRGIRVRYFQYRDAVDAIKRNQLDNDYYHREINQYRNCEVLLLDDLFKGAVRNGTLVDADQRIMFGIINHRYMEGKPMLVSSELSPDQIIALEDSIGGRIMERCKGWILEFDDPSLNHRLYD